VTALPVNLHPALAVKATEPQCYLLVRVSVVARGVMFAGICWEVQGQEFRVTECVIVWFAMFSHFDRVVDLLEVAHE
jgi:hypothetical protein